MVQKKLDFGSDPEQHANCLERNPAITQQIMSGFCSYSFTIVTFCTIHAWTTGYKMHKAIVCSAKERKNA